MSGQLMLFLGISIIILLLVIICYRQFLFVRGMRANLKKVSEKLSDILEQDSDEKVMVFTDDKALQDLIGQINRMLLNRQKTGAVF